MGRRSLRLVLGLLLAGGVAYALWRSWSDPRLSNYEWHLELAPFGLALVLMATRTVAAVQCWAILFRGLGGALAARDAFRIYFVSDLGKYLPGHVVHTVGRVAEWTRHAAEQRETSAVMDQLTRYQRTIGRHYWVLPNQMWAGNLPSTMLTWSGNLGLYLLTGLPDGSAQYARGGATLRWLSGDMVMVGSPVSGTVPC